ncbi:hypothetical protein ACSLNR_29965 [Escherichia coli]
MCVNDGSTDGSLDIILSFDDQRIKVINQNPFFLLRLSLNDSTTL